MIIEDLQCCAVDELAEIGFHNGPEDILRSFIKVFTYEDYDHVGGYYTRTARKTWWNRVGNFYIFTGVVAVDDVDEDDPEYDDTQNINVGYSEDLYNYIKEHDLGSITRSVSRTNRVNHPTHHVRVYVWSPDHEALKTLAEKKGWSK